MPLVQCVVCRLSVTFCIVAKRYVLAKNCLKEQIGNQGQKVDFFGRRHISTSGFAGTAPYMAVFCLMYCGETVRHSKQETQLKLAVADRTKPEVEIWRQPKKINFLTPVSYSLLQTVFR